MSTIPMPTDPTNSATGVATQDGTDDGTDTGVPTSSSTGQRDDTSTDDGESSDSDSSSGTGLTCEPECPDQQHCEVGECVWDEGVTLWTQTFDTGIVGGIDGANAVVIDSQDEVVVAGRLATANDAGVVIPGAFDVIVRKYDTDGGLLWSETRPQGNGVDLAITDGDELMVAIGSFGAGAEAAAGYDAAGNPLWVLAGTGAISDGIGVGPDGSFYVVGWYLGDTPWAAQYTTLGANLWTADTLGTEGRYRRAELLSDGMLLGLVGSNTDDTGLAHELLQTWPTDVVTGTPGPAPTLNALSVSSADIIAAYAMAIEFMGNGDMIVVSNELTPIESWNRALTRYAADGTLLWRETFNNRADAPDGGFGVALDSDENIIVAGGGQRPDLAQGSNVWVGKYDSDGTVIWIHEHDEAGLDDTARDVAVDSEDFIVVAGEIDAGDGNGTQMWVRKFAP